MKDLIKEIKENPKYGHNKIFLIQAIDEFSGFLLNNNQVWFISLNKDNSKEKTMHTIHLNLTLNLLITGVEESSYFKPGYYNVISFNDIDNNDLLDIFVSLCKTYSEKSNALEFNEYFNFLMELFQNSTQESYTNALGFFGELIVIKHLYDRFNLDISPYWHINGSYDHRDFSMSQLSIEVKTTLKPEFSFQLKHTQVFNDEDIYLILIRAQEVGSGTSVADLLKYFKTTNPFNSNLRFQILLDLEMTKLKKEYHDKKFSMMDVHIYFNKNLTRMTKIPNNISSISYMYDFSGEESMEVDKFQKILDEKLD